MNWEVPCEGFLMMLRSVIVGTCTAAFEAAFTLRGASTTSTVRKTGEASSPFVFVEQPGRHTAIRAITLTGTSAATRFLMFASVLLHDPRRDEDHQLVGRLGDGLVLEEVPDQR